MSDIGNISNDSDDERSRKDDDCALIDELSELNFNEKNNIESIRNLEKNEQIDDEMESESSSSLNFVEEEYDYLHDSEWINQRLHVFILSSAGKPIYTLNGDEDKLNTLFALMQALVSVVQSTDDCIKSITAQNTTFVFLVRSPLILVGVSKSKRSEQQILNRLL
jgi:hypothetical protein